MAVHGRAAPPRPRSPARLRALATLRHQGRGDVGQRPGVRARARRGAPPTPRASRGRRRRPLAGSSRASSRCRRVSVWLRRSSPIAPAASRRQRDRVIDPGQRGRDRQRLVDHLAAGIRQRQQVAGEVAAVDRRHVGRLERLQVARVVPVVQVAAVTVRGWPMVASVASSRSTISSVPIQPKSRAVTVASRYMPMFVGEVRCATTGLGSSWKLSGGRAWSSGPTNVSKNRQVRRAIRRSAATSAAESCSAGRFGRWQADPSGDERREQPQDDERRGDPGGARLQDEDEDRRRDRDRDAAGHLPVEPGEVEVVAGLGLRGGRPFEQVPAGDVQPRRGSARSRRPSATPGGRGT